MEYWRGYMDWPLDLDWKCESCNSRNLIWGFPHALCHCDICHTQYRMRDENNERVTIPISQLKDEYKETVKKGWNNFKIPLDEFSDKQWAELGK